MLLLFINTTIFGQNNKEYYYYYKGAKKYLELNTDYLFVSSSSKQEVSNFNSITGLKKTSIIKEDVTYTTLHQVNGAKKISNIYYWKELELTSSSKRKYQNEIKKIQTTNSNLIIAPYFKNEEGKKIGLSNYFYVKLKDKEDYKVLKKLINKYQVPIIGYNKFMPLWFTISTTNHSLNALELANLFYETGLFAHAEPDLMMDVQLSANHTKDKTINNMLTPNDNLYNDQWGLNNTGQNSGTSGLDINAEAAWNITTGNPAIRVAVLDHGFEMDHPDLTNTTYGSGFDTETGTSPSQVLGNHGTTCAGIIGAEGNNGIGVSGVAFNSNIVSISNSLIGSPNSRQARADGINWAVQNGVDIISNSWGSGIEYAVIDDAIDNALTQGRNGLGSIIVFATGNNNSAVSYPANSNPNILAVGAMSPCGQRKNPSSCDGENWGSNYGNELDIVAPGVLIATTDRQGNNGYNPNYETNSNYTTEYYSKFNGTSSACPFVAGVAALVLSVNPNLTVQEVNAIIEQSAQKVGNYNYTNTANRPNGTWNNEMGYGLLDAHQAVLLAQQTSGCQQNLTITQNVYSGQTDNQQASNTLIATNVIHSGGTASYKAGVRIRLQAGFKATSGSNFRAFIENCSGRNIPQQNSREVVRYSVDTTNEYKESLNTLDITENVGFQIYPNPVKEFVHININTHILTHGTIQIYDINGALVRTHTIQKNDSSDVKLDVSQLKKGIYIVKIIDDKKAVFVKKIIKE